MGGNYTLTLSIILAVRNEEAFIRDALTDLLTQEYDYENAEILIADGMSTDKTLEIICNTLRNFPNRQVRVFKNELGLLYCGVNRLISQSKGEILLKVDAHSRFPANFFKANLQALEDSKVDIVGGTCITNDSGIGFSKAISACLSTCFGVGDSKWRIYGESGESDVVPFPCIRRAVFHKVGLFREEQKRNADLEFFGRVWKAGLRVYTDSNIKSIYFPRQSLWATAVQMYQNGKWLPAQLQSVRPRHAAPLAFIIATTGLPFLSLKIPFLGVAWLSMISIYLLIAIVSAATYKQKKLDFLTRLKMLLCYPVIHFSYGFGWVAGFFSKQVRQAKKRGKQFSPPKPETNLQPSLKEVRFL